MKVQRPIGLQLSISARNDGTLEAVYICVGDGKVARTEEIIEDILLADYNRRGDLVGIEILAPVKIQRITSLVDQPRRRTLRRFIKERAPEELVLA